MQIAPNSVVSLTYKLSIHDEEGQPETIEIVEADEPMAIIVGMSGLPEGFETNQMGLNPGDSFDFTLTSEEGYGPRDPEAVVELPLDVFKVEGKIPDGLLDPDNVLPMTNEDGHRLQGRVVEIQDELVLMDFNHPLADKNMHFEGQVLTVRAATPTELEHGHVHGEGGVHH
ncbi:MAG: FKBP-type peptidyl-prolyl cis-trans isomerase [Cytophagaceae bacterium]|nr:FKBP-type peptidyl-prolyl cis-trans isomerase [Cytophagaceae bacterium]